MARWAKHLWAYKESAESMKEAGRAGFGVWNTAWGQAASSFLCIFVNHRFKILN